MPRTVCQYGQQNVIVWIIKMGHLDNQYNFYSFTKKKKSTTKTLAFILKKLVHQHHEEEEEEAKNENENQLNNN